MPDSSPRRGRPASALALLGWVVVAAVLVAAPVAAGADLVDTVRYLATWVLSTTVPGVLVWRACARPSSLVEELGFGNVLGIGLLLLAWVPAVLVGDATLAWWWPVVAIVTFAAVPSLRRLWWPRRTEPSARTRPRWHLAIAAVCVVGLGRLFVVVLRNRPLPGRTDLRVHPDLWFQQSLVNQLEHTLALQDPEAAGVPKSYHWLSNADIAVTSQLSGAPSLVVLFYLWFAMMTIVMVLAAAALARRLMDDGDRRWWVGPLAALLVAAVPVTMDIGEPVLRNLGNGFVEVSPSGVLGLVVMLAVSGPVIDLLRGYGGRGTWVLAVLLMALAAGTKPSDLPIVIAALLLVATVQLVRTHHLPTIPLVLALVAAVLIGAASVKLTGGAGGLRLLPFQTLVLDTQMQVSTGRDGLGGILLTGLGLFVLTLGSELPRLLGMLGIAYRRTRSDPAIWWCSGLVFGGFCASWLVSQPGFSQQYFWRVVTVLAVVTSMVVAVRVVSPGAGPRAVAGPLLTVVAAGLALGVWVLQWDPVDVTASSTGPFDRLVPYGVAVIVLAAAIALWRLPALRRRGRSVPVFTLVLAFSFAAGTPTAAHELQAPVQLAVDGADAPYSSRVAPRLVTADEQRAGLWLRQHADRGDRVVTNVVCVPTRYVAGCESTAFWVAALSGLRAVLGGWGYTEQGRDAYPAGGAINYKQRPPPFPERAQLSLAMIREPTAAVARRLRNGYDARWVFADRRATTVSPGIAQYADLRYQNSDVLVYELR